MNDSDLIQEFITNHLENNFKASQIKTPFIYKTRGDESLTKFFEDRRNFDFETNLI